MAETKIEWTATRLPDGTLVPGYTFNPWIGCTKVSDGCKFCYAETLMDNRYGRVKWGPQGTRSKTSDAYWRKPFAWNEKAKQLGVRLKVFCASLADVFEDRPELIEWREELLALILDTPNLNWLLLTKRPQNVEQMVDEILGPVRLGWDDLPNVWIGTSVENQYAANERIPHLLSIPARVRFLSAEPLLGNVWIGGKDWSEIPKPKVDWVIVGAESGPNHRVMNLSWAHYLRLQCRLMHIPFFMKQLGGHPDKRHDISRFPVDLQIREFPIGE